MRNFILLLSFLSVGCASVLSLQKPTAELSRVYARDTNLIGTTLIFVVEVQNPNDRELKVDEVSYTVFISDQEFAKSTTGREVTLAPGGKSEVEIPLPITYAKLVGSLGEVLQSGQVSYKIQGAAKLSLFKIPFSQEGKVDLRGE